LLSEYGLTDLSPASIEDFVTRMYNDADLESLYAWNSDRRGAARGAGSLHNMGIKCLTASEVYE
jgi:hypothetical protein